MPNKVVSRTQVPVAPEDLYFEVGAVFDEDGSYLRHQVRLLYQARDDKGEPIGARRDVQDLSLTGPQRTALANFVATVLSHANTREGT